MADNPIKTPLPADLPTDWVYGQTVAPAGSDAGLSEQHGYNYLMEQVNSTQEGVNALGEAFESVPELDNGKVPTSQLPVGIAGGIAGLDGNGKVPSGQLDLSGYVPATRKINNKPLSSDVTLNAPDVGAVPTTRTVNGKALSADVSLTASDVGALPLSGGMMTGNLYAFDDSDPSNPKVRNSLLTDTELNDSILVQMPEGCIAWLYE